MAVNPTRAAPKLLGTLFRSGSLTGMGDRELLECFAARLHESDEAAELAFATLLERHGPMVIRVCRAVLGDRHEAEDAFQAAFLVLASRAASIKSGGSVASWLHGVALRVALSARSKAIRRRRHEQKLAVIAPRATIETGETLMVNHEQDRVLHEEIGRLPDRFRTALVLCYLEGLTHEQAAIQLGCPVGTIRSRLATARDKLYRKLSRKGFGGKAPASLPEPDSASPVVPAALADATIRGALRVSLGKTALAAAVSSEAFGLFDAACKTMAATRLTWIASTAVCAALTVGGLGYAGYTAARRASVKAADQAADPGSQQTRLVKKLSSLAVARSKSAPRAKAQQSPDELTQLALQDSEEFVSSVIDAGEAAIKAYGQASVMAPNADEQRIVGSQHRRELASFAGMLLSEAERHPGTPVAEHALNWIAKRVGYDSATAERARELLARDYIQSSELLPLLNHNLIIATDSPATEKLMRNALARNPDREIKARACYYLARHLQFKAELEPFGRPRRPGEPPATKVSQGHRASSSEALEREAEALYERAENEFGDLVSPEIPPSPTGEYPRELRYPPLAEVARFHLRDIKLHGLGRPAPEISGLDIDGKPFKLSDYRGKVVALFFGGPALPGARTNDQTPSLIDALARATAQHASEPFALLGVSTISPGRSAGREVYQMLVKEKCPQARYWWDFNPDGTRGPIQTAWNNAGGTQLFLLDHRGVIRYKKWIWPDRLEDAIALLLAERKADAEKHQ